MSEELDRLYLRSKLKASEEKAVKDMEGKLDKLLAKLEDRDLSEELKADWKNDFKQEEEGMRN